MSTQHATALDRNEHRILALMLLALHATIWWDAGAALSRSMMLVHLGLFLLWQPLLDREHRIDLRGGAVLALIAGAFIAAASWLLIGFWVLLLLGLVAGRVNVARRQRHIYLASVVVLVLELLIGCIPRMFALSTPTDEFMTITNLALLAVPLVLLLLPARAALANTTRAVDFLYGAGLSLLTLTLGLGALVSTLALDTSYPAALIQTVLGIALFLLAIAWLWAPIAGFSGLGQIWERYVQNIGTPFEHWLSELQASARDSDSSHELLESALDQLQELHWVSGLEWRLRGNTGARGARTEHAVSAGGGPVQITLFAYRPMGTTLMLHARLLVRLVTHFLLAREREQELARQAHLQAIYETGARVTHDIKNLLQSLAGMTSAVEEAHGAQAEAAQAMVLRQLPQLSSRLELALSKLQSPQPAETRWGGAAPWWDALVARSEGLDLTFHLDLDPDSRPELPLELFDSVVDNLTDNARLKRQSEPGITITVSLQARDGALCLSVQDSGSALAPEKAEAVFQGPVMSATGLGIGLFQAARQAQRLGYSLSLAHNEPGRVRFELRGTARAARVDADRLPGSTARAAGA